MNITLCNRACGQCITLFSEAFLVNIGKFLAFCASSFDLDAVNRKHDGRRVDVRKFDEMGELKWWNSS